MNLLRTIFLFGVPLAICLFALMVIMLKRNPRLLLHAYPEDVRAAVEPKSLAEKRKSAYWTAMFLILAVAFPFSAALASKAANRQFLEIFFTAFGVLQLFNFMDWLLFDWLIVCTLTPAFLVIPGTDGMAGYKNYRMHVASFLVGSMLAIVLGLLIVTIVVALPVFSASDRADTFARA
jgi:hypothetical protein